MFTKIKFIAAALLTANFAFAAELGEDGLHKAPWFHETFKDMREDLEEAKAEGKTLLIMWEQRGCIYCTKMHEEVFPVPEISQKLTDEFFVVQYNLFGDVEVTDFDGEVMAEKDMALKWGVLFTPTLMFFPDEVAEDTNARDAAVAIMPSAFGKWTTANLLTWVREKGYENGENFQKYHAQKIMEAREKGELPDE